MVLFRIKNGIESIKGIFQSGISLFKWRINKHTNINTRLKERLNGEIMNIYVAKAKEFLRRNNAKMSITFKEVKRNPWNEKKYGNWLHNIYRVRIDRNGKSFSFDFTDSAHNYQNNEKPTCYDVLACLQKYEIGDYFDFCSEFGYEPYDYDFEDYIKVNGEYYNRKSWNTYKTVKKEYENVMRLFGDVIEELAEIQ